jgi:hypothetical protein
VDYTEVSVEGVVTRGKDEAQLRGTSALDDVIVGGGVLVVVVQVVCIFVAAVEPLGPFYSRSMGRTGRVRFDSSNLGFAASDYCTGRSAICCGFGLVARYR